MDNEVCVTRNITIYMIFRIIFFLLEDFLSIIFYCHVYGLCNSVVI